MQEKLKTLVYKDIIEYIFLSNAFCQLSGEAERLLPKSVCIMAISYRGKIPI